MKHLIQQESIIAIKAYLKLNTKSPLKLVIACLLASVVATSVVLGETAYRDTPLLLTGFPGGNPLPGLVPLVGQQAIERNEVISRQTFSDHYGYTPLHVASSRNNIDMVKTLISNGANINARTLNGQTALHIAAIRGYIELVDIVLKLGVMSELRDKSNKTAMERAVDSGQVEAVRLLQTFASVEEKKFDTLQQAAKYNDVVTLKRLLKHSDINQPHGEYQWTALHTAAANNSHAALRLLLQQGADIRALEAEYRRTALHIAAILGDLEAVRQLVKAGAVNHQDSQTETALQMASYSGHLPVVDALIKAGADMNIRNIFDESALVLAIINGHADIANLLLAQGATLGGEQNNGLLHETVRSGQVQLVAQLIKKGDLQLNNINEDGETPLHIAATQGNADMVALLIKSGADMSVRSDDILGGQTALHVAVVYGHQEVAKRLLESGIDVDVRQTENHMTALHLAAQDQQRLPIAQLLMTHGADLDVISNDTNIIPSPIVNNN